MGLTVMPNDDGTLDITQDGTTVTYDPDDVERCGLAKGDKAFLRSMFRYAAPGPVACPAPRPPGGGA